MRLYITGGTGFLGSNILKVAQETRKADVFTTVYSYQPADDVTFGYGQVDMRNAKQVMQSVKRYTPTTIIHSAILNDFAAMYRERQLAWESYVSATRHLVAAANAVGAKFILISTDWVFDGTQGIADEDTPPNPINIYGVLKTIAETVVAESAENGVVARVSGVNGHHWLRPKEERLQNLGFGHFCTAVVKTLQQGQSFPVWTAEKDINLLATPSLASESAEMIMRIIEKDVRGICHCCIGETIDRMTLAQLTAEVFELDTSLITSSKPDRGEIAGVPIPVDTRLDAAKTAAALEYQLPTVRSILETYRNQLATNSL